jgi:hypothetical protein
MLIFFVPVLDEAVETGFTGGLAAGPGVAPDAVAFAAESVFCAAAPPAGAAAPGAGAAPVAPPLLAKACETGLRSTILAPATARPREAVAGVDGPIARAKPEAASLSAFSLI